MSLKIKYFFIDLDKHFKNFKRVLELVVKRCPLRITLAFPQGCPDTGLSNVIMCVELHRIGVDRVKRSHKIFKTFSCRKCCDAVGNPINLRILSDPF